MKPSRIRRHVWGEDDVCIQCGLARDGFTIDRATSTRTRYTNFEGFVFAAAGECKPRSTEEVEASRVAAQYRRAKS